MEWNITRLEPTSRDGVGFWDGRDENDNPIGGFTTDLPRWMPEGRHRAFRRARRASGETLRQSSDMLGMKPSEVSGLEHGRADLSPEQWEHLMAIYATPAAAEEDHDDG